MNGIDPSLLAAVRDVVARMPVNLDAAYEQVVGGVPAFLQFGDDHEFTISLKASTLRAFKRAMETEREADEDGGRTMSPDDSAGRYEGRQACQGPETSGPAAARGNGAAAGTS